MFKKGDVVKFKKHESEGIIICRDVEPNDFYVHAKYLDNEYGDFMTVLNKLEYDYEYYRKFKLQKIIKNVQKR